jgi:hypothetical protein
MNFRAITQALSRMDWSGLELYVVDIDCVPKNFMLQTFRLGTSAGAGETCWVRDGVIAASVLTYSPSGVEAEFDRLTRELLYDTGV